MAVRCILCGGFDIVRETKIYLNGTKKKKLWKITYLDSKIASMVPIGWMNKVKFTFSIKYGQHRKIPNHLYYTLGKV